MSSRYRSRAAPNSPICRPAAPRAAPPPAAERAGPHQSRDEPQDDDDDQELDEREAALIPQEPARRRASHSGRSVTERKAISMAAQKDPTTTPITRMMHGSASAMSRLTSLRVSASSSVATRRSISSRRPGSSPPRTTWVGTAGE